MRVGRGKGLSTPVRRLEADCVGLLTRYHASSVILTAGRHEKAAAPFEAAAGS